MTSTSSVYGSIYEKSTHESVKFVMPLNFGITNEGFLTINPDVKKDVSITIFTQNGETKIGIYDPIGNIIKRPIKELNNGQTIGFGTRCQCVISYDNDAPMPLYVGDKIIMINRIEGLDEIEPQFVCTKVLLYC